MHARNTKTAIDTLTFQTDVQTMDESQITSPPSQGVCIHLNLYLLFMFCC